MVDQWPGDPDAYVNDEIAVDEIATAQDGESTGDSMVRVVARVGYTFTLAGTDIPTVTADGVNVTPEQADALVAASDGMVFIVDSDATNEDEEN